MRILKKNKPFNWVLPIDTFGKSKQDVKVIFIGSGITNLCLAALLSKEGYKVQILESSKDSVGGHARMIKINGVNFSAGPQYLWNFGEGETGNKILKYLGLHKEIEFEKMLENGFETIYLLGIKDPIEVPMGLVKFRDKLIDLFPAEKKGITRFFNYTTHLQEAVKYIEDAGLYLLDAKTMKIELLKSSEISLKTKLYGSRFSKWSLKKMFDFCDLGDKVRRVIFGHSGIFCESEEDLSYIVYVAATTSYHRGAWIPKKGFSHFISSICELITREGGEILLNKKVNKIIYNSNKTEGVVCADGSKYDADFIVSGASPLQTFRLLEGYKDISIKYQPSNSMTGAFILLKNYKDLREKMNLRNIWWQVGEAPSNFCTPDMMQPFEFMYIGANNNELSQEDIDRGYAGIIMFAPANFEQSKDFASKGKAIYIDFKIKLKEKFIRFLQEKFFPDISNNIVGFKLYTPWDTFEELGAECGNIYGRRLNYENVSMAIPQFEKTKNLFVTCASIGMPGVAVGFQTAAILFNKLTNKDIFNVTKND